MYMLGNRYISISMNIIMFIIVIIDVAVFFFYCHYWCIVSSLPSTLEFRNFFLLCVFFFVAFTNSQLRIIENPVVLFSIFLFSFHFDDVMRFHTISSHTVRVTWKMLMNFTQ